MERIELHIGGMSCAHCVQAVQRALQGVEGVEVEAVEIGSARVEFDSDRVRPDQIRTAVEEEGFSVRSMETSR